MTRSRAAPIRTPCPATPDKRAVLAAPVDGRLFFAGEATSPNFFSTAHGARDCGERAAGEVYRSKHNRRCDYSITLARNAASGTKHSSYFPKIR